MITYVLKKFDQDGRLAGHCEFQGDSDEEVLRWAAKLPRSFRYEVWLGERRLYASRDPEGVPPMTISASAAPPAPLEPGAGDQPAWTTPPASGGAGQEAPAGH